MKNVPKKIYLQISQYAPTDDFKELNRVSDVTWCEDKINDNDIEYVLASELEAMKNIINFLDISLRADSDFTDEDIIKLRCLITDFKCNKE